VAVVVVMSCGKRIIELTLIDKRCDEPVLTQRCNKPA